MKMLKLSSWFLLALLSFSSSLQAQRAKWETIQPGVSTKADAIEALGTQTPLGLK